jgi:hypothetical protein
MLNLATLDNIQAVSAQDAGLASLSHFPPHSREYFAIKISQYGRRCFVGAFNCGLGMDFLPKLTNIVEDSKLPVRRRVNIEAAYQDALLVFKAAPTLICAPVFTIGEYRQRCAFQDSLPLTSIVRNTESDDDAGYTVVFHRAHLRESLISPLGDNYPGRVEYFLSVFPNMQLAKQHSCWPMRRFGFKCERRYHVCYE